MPVFQTAQKGPSICQQVPLLRHIVGLLATAGEKKKDKSAANSGESCSQALCGSENCSTNTTVVK